MMSPSSKDAVSTGGTQRSRSSSGRALYLVAYNVLCFCLWAHISALVWIKVRERNENEESPVWIAVRYPLMLAQSVALLEIVHAATGLVRSSAGTVAIQVLSRLHIIFWIWRLSTVAASSSTGLVATVGAWGAAEVIRYPFYAVSAMSSRSGPPYWLKWLRYSGFILLYPIGITGEIRSIFLALPTLQRTPSFRAYPVPMPNLLNFQMDLYAVYLFILLCYIPGSFHMYFHMLKQRARALRSVDDNSNHSHSA